MRLTVLLLVSLASLAVGFLFPISAAHSAIRVGGYYFAALLSALWLGYALYAARGAFGLSKVSKQAWVHVSVLLSWAVLVFTSYPAAFQVMNDEAAQLSTALTLNHEKEVYTAHKGYWVDGQFEVLDGALDKRPFLYPFVVSLLHEVVGYNVANAFWLNFACGLGSLLLGYCLFSRWFSPHIGFAAMLLLACSPVLVLSVRAAGFEAMNFLFLGILGGAVWAYARSGDRHAECLLILTTLMLTYLRYESCVIIVPVGLLILLKCYERKELAFGNATILAPVGLIPFVWLYRCTESRVGSWQYAETDGIAVFSMEHFIPNLVDAFAYLFDPRWHSSNNFFLGLFGACGLLLLLFRAARKPFSAIEGIHGTAVMWQFVVCWLLSFLCLLLVILCYFWSSFLDVLCMRMSLPFLWPLALGFCFLATMLVGRFSRLRYLPLVLAIVGILFGALPSMRAERSREANTLARSQTWKMNWANQNIHDLNRVLVIDHQTSLWTAMQFYSIQPGILNERMSELYFHWQAESFDTIYVVQVHQRGAGGHWVVSEGAIPEALKLDEEIVAKYDMSPAYRVTLRRVQDVHFSGDRFQQFWDAQKGRSDATEVYKLYEKQLLLSLP